MFSVMYCWINKNEVPLLSKGTFSSFFYFYGIFYVMLVFFFLSGGEYARFFYHFNRLVYGVNKNFHIFHHLFADAFLFKSGLRQDFKLFGRKVVLGGNFEQICNFVFVG